MSKLRQHSLFGLVCAVLSIVPQGVQAQAIFRPFSADQIQTIGKKTTNSKVYAIEKAFRTEGEQKGKPTITILRLDRKVIWNLMPDQKMYMELPGVGASISELARDVQGADMQRETLGMEQVGAYNCEKQRVRVTYEGKVYTSIQWAAKELDGFVVKTQGEKGEYTKEFQNIHLGPQDPSLFEIPAGYQKFSLGGLGRGRSQN